MGNGPWQSLGIIAPKWVAGQWLWEWWVWWCMFFHTPRPSMSNFTCLVDPLVVAQWDIKKWLIVSSSGFCKRQNLPRVQDPSQLLPWWSSLQTRACPGVWSRERYASCQRPAYCWLVTVTRTSPWVSWDRCHTLLKVKSASLWNRPRWLAYELPPPIPPCHPSCEHWNPHPPLLNRGISTAHPPLFTHPDLD